MDKTILLIEDDMTLCRMYEKALKNAGFSVILASEGKEGFSKAKLDIPSLILLDIMLPGGKNGFDVLSMFKQDEQLKTVPIICLTNLDSERQTALDMGAVDYMIKADTAIDELVGKIRTIIS